MTRAASMLRRAAGKLLLTLLAALAIGFLIFRHTQRFRILTLRDGVAHPTLAACQRAQSTKGLGNPSGTHAIPSGTRLVVTGVHRGGAQGACFETTYQERTSFIDGALLTRAP